MKLEDLKRETVYVDARGLSEMVVLDLEHTYDEEWYFQRSVNGYRTGHGNFLAILVRDTFDPKGLDIDLIEASKEVTIDFAEKFGGAWSRTPAGTKVSFIRARMIAGELNEVRNEIARLRDLDFGTAGRRTAMEFDIQKLVPEHDSFDKASQAQTTIHIDVLNRLIELAQSATNKS